MSVIDRRQALQFFGLISFTPLLSAGVPVNRRGIVVRPGENRYPYSVAAMHTGAACKLTAQDSGGTSSIFELVTPPRTGPPRHIHHREDEWYYVLTGHFAFEVGDLKYTVTTGGAVWAPRDIPHVWANTGTADGRMILVCQPGGFEQFFDEFAKAGISKDAPEQMVQAMAKYGMEMLGPPLFQPLH
jgi:mannose-6-phosphate isomerase-like protein (cupin superfamily)